jgi:hypothetical protein
MTAAGHRSLKGNHIDKVRSPDGAFKNRPDAPARANASARGDPLWRMITFVFRK